MNWFKQNKIIVFAAYILVIGALAFGGYFLNRNNQKQIIHNVQNELQSIAMLKIDQISDFYSNELYDAKSISQNIELVNTIESWIQHSDSIHARKLKRYFNDLQDEHSTQEILLVSPEYQFLFSTAGEEYEIEPKIVEAAKACLLHNSSASTDLYVCKYHQDIHIDFLAPVYNNDMHLLCFVVFVIDTDNFLNPLLQKWPVPSKTAETSLIRKDGDYALYLNQLRHRQGTALNLRIPLTELNVPAVQAVNGKIGIFEGMDYRGIKVISYINKIPETPWYMVVKVDEAELYETATTANRTGFLLVAILILLIFSSFAFVYAQSQKNFYKNLWNTQQEFRTILYSIGDAVITTDEKGLIRNMNPIAEQLTGWQEQPAVGKPISQIFKIIGENTREKVIDPVQKVIHDETIVNLVNHTILISRDGKEIPIANSGAPIKDREGEIIGVVLVFRDQTPEREHERIVEEQARKWSMMMGNLPGIAYRCLNDQNWTMEFISKGSFELTGYYDDELIENRVVSYNDVIAEEFRTTIWDQVQAAILEKNSFEFEYQIKTKNGDLKWVWERGQGVFDEEGNLVALEGLINDIDHRKKTESALKASERLFQSMAENLTVGIFRTDANGKTIYVNPKWCEIAGVEKSQALGDRWMERIHPLDRTRVESNWQEAMQKKQLSRAEYRFLRSNGTIVYVKGQAVPEFSNDNQLIGYTGTITDVTDIKEAEHQLISSNLLLRALIDNIPDAIYIKDVQGKKILANKADLINIGASSEDEVIGKTDFDVFPHEIAQQFWEIDLKVIGDGSSILYHEEELKNEKNQVKWLSTSKIPYRDAAGKIIGIIGIGHDITQRKQDEEEKMKLFTILTQSPVSIVITNDVAEIDYVNPKFTEVSGYSFDEVLGQNPRILKSGDQSVDFYKEMWDVISKGGEFRGEFHNKKKNGELYWENAIIAPIKNDKGVIINYVAVKEDITDKKQLMHELIYAKEKAEQSERLKTSFLANMSHEIRTPLNSILGFSSILTERDDFDEEEKDQYISIINKSSESLLQIINDIIDISSLETGQLKIRLSNFKVNDMINILFREFNRRIAVLKLENLTLKISLADTELQLHTDQNRLNQIFINLLTNAIKFTSVGHIEFGVEKYDENFVYFKVEDTGIGISKENHDLVFERFRQAENNKTRQYGGNGLGLSIVKNLLELMGGKISLDSEPDKGSVFRFHLPYKFPGT